MNGTSGRFTLSFMVPDEDGQLVEMETPEIEFNATALDLFKAISPILNPTGASRDIDDVFDVATRNLALPFTDNVLVSKFDNVFHVTFQGVHQDLLIESAEVVAGSGDIDLEVVRRRDGINYYGVETLDVLLSDNDDRFSVQGTWATTTTNLDTAGGDDLIYVSSGALIEALDEFSADRDWAAFHNQVLHYDRLDPDPTSGAEVALRPGGTLDYVQGELNIQAGTGHNTLSMSDRNDPDADGDSTTPVVITEDSVTGLAPAVVNYDATGGDFSGQGKWNLTADFGDYGRGVTFYGGTGGNTIDVTSIHTSGLLGLPFTREITTLFTGRSDDNVSVSVADDTGRFLVVRGEAGDDAINASPTSLPVTTLPVAIFGDEDHDTIDGGTNADQILGDEGRIYHLRPDASPGYDIVLGGEPVDDTTTLTNDDDFMTADFIRTVIDEATDAYDLINAHEANDIVLGGGNARDTDEVETIVADQGDDIVVGDYGHVTLIDGVVRIIETTDRVDGGSDLIYGNTGQDILIGGAAGDVIDGDEDEDLIFGDNVRLERLGTNFEDVTNPRFRALKGTMIYGEDNDPDTYDDALPLVGDTHYANPANTPTWADFEITLLDHSADDETFALNNPLNNFGNDYIAGGTEDDTIFGQLGDDVIQGDGSVDGRVDDHEPVDATRDATLPGSTIVQVGELWVRPSFPTANDGDDYIEGNGGDDLIFGNLGQDDIVGGSSDLFDHLTSAAQRPDGRDIIFGGAGTAITRNYSGSVNLTPLGDVMVSADELHAHDADVIAGDNANIYRLVGVNEKVGNDDPDNDVATFAGFLQFNYDDEEFDGYSATLKIIPRAVELLDYTPGGADFNDAATADNGGGDEIHGESGDDTIYAQVGDDVVFGDGQDDDVIGGHGEDWISGGTGDDGILGDDGRIYTSRNSSQLGEPLFNIDTVDVDQYISTPGKVQQATIHVNGQLKKTVNLTPFNVDDPTDGFQDRHYDALDADDIIYGGLGNDWLHGGAGDDAISGAEALAETHVELFPDDSSLSPNPDRTDGVIWLSGYNAPLVLEDIAAELGQQYHVLGFGALRAEEFAAYNEYEPRTEIVVEGHAVPAELRSIRRPTDSRQ